MSLLATTTLYELKYHTTWQGCTSSTCSSNYYATTIQCLILTPVFVTFCDFVSNFRKNTAKTSTKLENTLRFFLRRCTVLLFLLHSGKQLLPDFPAMTCRDVEMAEAIYFENY